MSSTDLLLVQICYLYKWKSRINIKLGWHFENGQEISHMALIGMGQTHRPWMPVKAWWFTVKLCWVKYAQGLHEKHSQCHIDYTSRRTCGASCRNSMIFHSKNMKDLPAWSGIGIFYAVWSGSMEGEGRKHQGEEGWRNTKFGRNTERWGQEVKERAWDN